MSLIVNNNLMAQNAARNLGAVFSRLGSSVQKLSSGLRVASAADDAAGMAIRELMRSDIAVLNQGVRNASDAISMIQTAEGGMSVIDEKLIRMKELAEQAATGTYTTAQREIMNSEYQAMAAEIDRIANATDFNGVNLLDGTMAALHNGSGLKVHFGTGNSAAEDYYYVTIDDMRATQGTGLRVGSNDTRDTWTTQTLNMSSADDLMADDGTFGIQYTHDGTNWSTYGWVTVNQETDTLASIAAEINQGPQHTATLTIAAGTTTSSLAGDTFTINGTQFTFSTADSAVSGTTIGIANNASVQEIGQSVAEALNATLHSTGESDYNVIAQGTGATLTLFFEDFGSPTSTIEITSASTSVGVTSWTATTGTHLGANVVYQDNYGYELQLEANQAGSAHQIRIISPNGNIIDTDSAGVTTLDTTTYGTLLTTADGATVVDEFDAGGGVALNTAANWTNSVNGSGNTTWAARDILTQSGAQQALAGLDSAINRKDKSRASLGALQNRLENTITNLQIQAENLQAAESRISDVDVAMEMTAFTRNNILAQAAVSMLAQANSLPSLALSLLGG